MNLKVKKAVIPSILMGNWIARRPSGFSDEIIRHHDNLVAKNQVVHRLRNATMRRLIIEHFKRCQSCDFPCIPTRSSYALEGAHVNPKSPASEYDNAPTAILCLCANCHLLYDHGLPESSQRIARNVQKRYPSIPYKWPPEKAVLTTWERCIAFIC